MEFTKDELREAKRQIDSTLHKLREAIKTFASKDNAERYKLQTISLRRNWRNRKMPHRERIHPYD